MKLINEITGSIIFDYNKTKIKKEERNIHTNMFYKIIKKILGTDYSLKCIHVNDNQVEDLIFMIGNNKENLIKGIEKLKDVLKPDSKYAGLKISFSFTEIKFDKKLQLAEGESINLVFTKDEILKETLSISENEQQIQNKLDEINSDITDKYKYKLNGEKINTKCEEC